MLVYLGIDRKFATQGGGYVTFPWYGLVPFYGYPFHDRVRIYGFGFEQCFAFSGFMGIVFCKNSFIGDFFRHFRNFGYDFKWYNFPDLWITIKKFLRIYGYTIKKFLRIYGYTFEKFLPIYGWCFHHLNGTTSYLGKSSDPPPPGLAILSCALKTTIKLSLSSPLS